MVQARQAVGKLDSVDATALLVLCHALKLHLSNCGRSWLGAINHDGASLATDVQAQPLLLAFAQALIHALLMVRRSEPRRRDRRSRS